MLRDTLNYVRVLETPINTQEVIDLVQSDACGAIDVFIGTVRNKTADKAVERLFFEAYEKMAIKEMEKIAERAKAQWPVDKLAIFHRSGWVEIGGIAVVIAVSTPHRKASFEACQFVIDTLKETVPIWKKEHFEDGEVWVAAHP